MDYKSYILDLTHKINYAKTVYYPVKNMSTINPNMLPHIFYPH